MWLVLLSRKFFWSVEKLAWQNAHANRSKHTAHNTQQDFGNKQRNWPTNKAICQSIFLQPNKKEEVLGSLFEVPPDKCTASEPAAAPLRHDLTWQSSTKKTTANKAKKLGPNGRCSWSWRAHLSKLHLSWEREAAVRKTVANLWISSDINNNNANGSVQLS